MQIVFTPDGDARAIHGDEFPLASLGEIHVERASHVEFDNAAGCWFADLGLVGGPLLTGFETRAAALAAEVFWLERFWLRAG